MLRICRTLILATCMATCLSFAAHASMPQPTPTTPDEIAADAFARVASLAQQLCTNYQNNPASGQHSPQSLANCISDNAKAAAKIIEQKAWAMNQVSCPQIVVDCAQGYHPGPMPTLDANGCQSAPACVKESIPTPVTIVDCAQGYHPGNVFPGRPRSCEKDIACPAGKHPVSHPCTSGDCSGVPSQTCEAFYDNGTDVPTTACPQYQQPICPANHHVEISGSSSSSCPGAPTCVPDTGSATSPLCPIIDVECPLGTQAQSGGTGPDGCPRAPNCVGLSDAGNPIPGIRGFGPGAVYLPNTDTGGYYSAPAYFHTDQGFIGQ